MDIDAIIARVWPGQPASAEVLGRGFTHHNFKVDVGGESFVLRVAGPEAALLGIDRRIEHEASLAAAAVGIGPEVVAFVEPEGYLVTRFIEGEVVPVESMRDAEIDRACRESAQGRPSRPVAVAQVQRVPGRRRVPLHCVRARCGGAVDLRLGPTDGAPGRTVARGVFAERPCHNDLLSDNLIDDGRRIRIVDWEYAGMGDVFFDLASFSANHQLDAEAAGHCSPPMPGTYVPRTSGRSS